MIFITAGGTGGHLFPAIALAQSYQKQFAKAQILLIGTLTPIDKEIFDQSGFDFTLIPFHRPSSGFIGKIKLVFQLMHSIAIAIKLIKKNQPQLIAACGGFGCVPLAIAARITKKPFVLLEQNVIPGRTNRFLASKASFIFTEFEEANSYFTTKAKLLNLGNPIRKNILEIDKGQAKDTIVFMGGSQGSTRVNEIAFEIIPEIVKKYPNLKVFHLTGKANFEKYRQNESHSQVKVYSFVNEMEKIYQNAKLIIGRSGATSIAEIAVLGVPTIYIPYPYAKDDHQKANAQALVNIGAGVMIEEKDITSETMLSNILSLLEDEKKWQIMSQKILAWAKPNAGEAIIHHLTAEKLLS